MSIKTRRFLFYSLVIVFILVGTFLVSNSRGYRLDWKNFQIEATGGIYITSTPTKTQIELDGRKIKNETGILQRGTLIDDLLPGKYSLSVQSDRHSSWQKDVEVKSGTVAVFDYIILIPEIDPVQISDVLASRIINSGKHMAVESDGGVSLDGTLVFGHEIVALSDSGTLLTRSTATDNYYIANAFEPDDNLNLTLVFNNLKSEKLNLPGAVDIKKALPYPYNDRRFIVATEQAIYVLDVDKLTIEQITENANDFFIQGQNNIAWQEDQVIKMFNLPIKSETVAIDLSRSDIESVSLKELLYTSSGWLALKTSGELAIFNQDTAPQIVDTSVKSFTLSPNEEGVAMIKKDNSLSVYNFEDEVNIEIDSSAPIQDFVWFKDSVHIIFLEGETLRFTEISDTGSPNSTVIAEGVQGFSYAGGDAVSFSNQSGVWEKIIID